MEEYIKKKDTEKAFDEADTDIVADFGDCWSECGFSRQKVKEVLDRVESHEPNVIVKCKDCEYSGVTEFGKRYCSEPLGMLGCVPTEDDNFCSHGRRREKST